MPISFSAAFYIKPSRISTTLYKISVEKGINPPWDKLLAHRQASVKSLVAQKSGDIRAFLGHPDVSRERL
jgi:hypothetical protein